MQFRRIFDPHSPFVTHFSNEALVLSSQNHWSPPMAVSSIMDDPVSESGLSMNQLWFARLLKMFRSISPCVCQKFSVFRESWKSKVESRKSKVESRNSKVESRKSKIVDGWNKSGILTLVSNVQKICETETETTETTKTTEIIEIFDICWYNVKNIQEFLTFDGICWKLRLYFQHFWHFPLFW